MSHCNPQEEEPTAKFWWKKKPDIKELQMMFKSTPLWFHQVCRKSFPLLISQLVHFEILGKCKVTHRVSCEWKFLFVKSFLILSTQVNNFWVENNFITKGSLKVTNNHRVKNNICLKSLYYQLQYCITSVMHLSSNH